jgi:phenylalanyl-tRNA synthetase alpha chain
LNPLREAFEREFERFARFTSEPGATISSLKEAEAELRGLADLRVRHTGKKSAIAAAKKLIGRVPAEQRASFGQLVQGAEAHITESIETAELALKTFIETARIARESLDVAIPPSPAGGHLHPITLMRQRIDDIFVSLGYAVEDDREIETGFL